MSKELYQALEQRGLTDYGSYITGAMVHDLLGIVFPEVGTKAQYDELTLKVLGAIDYVRNILLSQGKYLRGQGSDYRILLPSENRAQVEQYMAQADRKLRRAGKLSRNTPSVNRDAATNQMDARIMLKRESTRAFAGRQATATA